MTEETYPAEFRDEQHQRLYRESGGVSDTRRAVQFLYLLLRDGTPLAPVHEAFLLVFNSQGEVVDWKVHAQRRPSMYFDAGRLWDVPGPAHYAFVVRLCDKLGKLDNGLPATIEAALKQVPKADDVEAYFSNGWLARYCQWLVRELDAAS